MIDWTRIETLLRKSLAGRLTDADALEIKAAHRANSARLQKLEREVRKKVKDEKDPVKRRYGV